LKIIEQKIRFQNNLSFISIPKMLNYLLSPCSKPFFAKKYTLMSNPKYKVHQSLNHFLGVNFRTKIKIHFLSVTVKTLMSNWWSEWSNDFLSCHSLQIFCYRFSDWISERLDFGKPFLTCFVRSTEKPVAFDVISIAKTSHGAKKLHWITIRPKCLWQGILYW